MIAVDAELHEDESIFDHGTQGADEPGQVGEEVLPLDGVEEDPGSIREVPQEREHEEQQRQSLAGFLPVILDDLRNARAIISSS